ncbi:MAG: anti-sigma factor [Acidimicrobiales bacterium]|nr:anti-sigma factor [Acidimicrobiales bacterium]
MSHSNGFGLEESEANDRETLELLDEMKSRLGATQPVFDAPPAEIWMGIEAALGADPPDAIHDPTVTTSLDQYRKRRRPVGVLLGAIAAAVLVAVAIGEIGDSTTTIGRVDLAALETGDAYGTATVVETGSGQTLQIELSRDLGAVADDEFYELWVIDTNVEGMYSLGPITADGTFVVPDGVDVHEFPIVDISLEQDDGDPAHGGASVVRGQL